MPCFVSQKHLNFFILINFLLSALLEGDVLSLQCYTCDSESNSIPNCDNFDKSDSTFAKECPQELSGSCIVTKSQGKIIQRFCQKETITGSHILNDVKYCYCDWNLCNDSMQRCQLAVSDDEDLATPEGSGQESTTIKPEVVRTNVHTTTSAESSNIKMCNLFVICLLQYFLYYAVL